MNLRHTLAGRIRRGEPIAAPLAALLTAATPVTRAGMWLRLHRARERVDAHVVSFGNLTAGGTGKTPAVIECAEQMIAAGHRVAIVTRGYQGRLSGGPHVFDRAMPMAEAARMFGDEPALMAHMIPEALIIKSPDRVAGAQLAVRQHECDTILLDDAFQYVRLERDENVLLIDAANPFGNGRLIPRGILREPVHAMKRATAICITRCDSASDLDTLLARIRAHTAAPVRLTRHAPYRLRRVSDGLTEPIGALKGRRIAAVCAIAQPESFFDVLERLGAEIGERRAYPDHHEFGVTDLPDETWIVTTAKDAVRIHTPPENLFALDVRLEDWEQHGA